VVENDGEWALRDPVCAHLCHTKLCWGLFQWIRWSKKKLECGSVPDVMAALPNVGGALCSTPQTLADAHFRVPRRETRWNVMGCPKLANGSQPDWAEVYHIVRICGETLLFNSFFLIVNTCLICDDIARQSCSKVPRWRIFGDFWVLHFQRAAWGTFQTCILNSH